MLADERDDEPEDEEKDSLFEKIRASFPLLMAWLYKHRNFTYEDMSADDVQKFVGEVTEYLNHAVDTAIREVPMAEVSVQRLKESNYVFSGIKVFHELNEAFPSMVDDKGEIRPFEDFLNDVQKVNNTYNGSYLRTEYNFARQSSLAAAQWKNYEKDGNRYNLQYRTAYDDRVRTSHRKLEGITLPITSKFWDDYFPPNGWNCRCTVVQVRKDKYAESDERTAIDLGSQATAGKHQEMFKFNPGKEMTTFPAYNAYTIRKCKNCKYNGTMKLAADIPDNELCGACRVVREDAPYSIVETERGRVRIHSGHGKNERKENLEIATYLANKYDYVIDLLDNPDNEKSADTFNHTLGIEQEYKVSATASKNSIDRLIREAKKQANNIVLRIDSDITWSDLSAGIRSRVRRSENIETITIIIEGKDVTLTREQILSDGFKIQLADLK